ncbi:toll-like receptor 2 [Pecten maximus]|uniref:toll-like receptor 2 n=1 Tax=Pecten maximus TaxID=6579 RepID=UPI001458ED0E|nr:toll-like receptor 2 [Pecten maximus]
MENSVFVLGLLCCWSFQFSTALTNCCHVTRMEWESHVTCSGCQMEDVPQDLPMNTTVLNLWNNRIVELDRDSFTYLPHLKYLILSQNGMYNVSPEAFSSLGNLEYLDLSDNYLEHSAFDSLVFQHLPKLRCLYLHRNHFHLKRLYPENALSFITTLQNLSIDIFDGFTFGKGFLNLTNLGKLDVYRTGAERVSIRNTSFKGLERSVITHLNLDFNMRSIEADSLSPFGSLISLTLDSKKTLSIHEVLLVLYGLRGRNMESIELSQNHVVYSRNGNLEKSDLVFLGTICVRKLDLTRNLISGITMEAVLSWNSRVCLEVLDLSRNVVASPQMLSLLVLFPSITHMYASYEINTFTRKRRGVWSRKTTVFLPTSLRYLYLSHDPSHFDISDATTVSDSNELRVLDVSYPIGGITCSGGYINGLVHLQELNISGWKCTNPNTQFFAKFPNLSRLEAKECYLGSRLSLDGNTLFTGMYNLSIIDLAFNSIKSLNLKTFEDQSYSLKVLNLTGNDMDRLPLESLTFLRVLEILDLRDNLITTLSDTECSFLDVYGSNLDKFKIMLAGNPLVCNCDNLDFVAWLHTTKTVYDRDHLSCSTPGGDTIKIADFLESFEDFQDSCVAQFWLLISIILTVVCILMGILSRLAWQHSVWVRVRCRQPLKHDVYPYDIFISYCDQDSGWVMKTLVPWLDEKGIGYCAGDKNFSPGLYEADNIMEAIDNSCQIVFVVSCTFLEREWPLFTMKLASTYSFREGRENMNIIIMLNDMKRSEFPKLLRKNWDVIRPVQWPDDSNTDQSRLTKAREQFWKCLLKRIKRGNSRFKPAAVSESKL